MKVLLPLLFSFFILPAGNTVTEPAVIDLQLYGVKIKVHDLDEAAKFYSTTLGFPVKMENDTHSEVWLDSKPWPISLEQTRLPHSEAHYSESKAMVGIQVNHLLPSIDELRDKGVVFFEEELEKNGAGISIYFKDSSGNKLFMMEQQIGPQRTVLEPVIYNMGFTFNDMEKAEHFYSKVLGFEAWSRNYLPDALPLKNPDQSFAFMLHYDPDYSNSTISYFEESHTLLIFSTSNLSATLKSMERLNIPIIMSDLDEKRAAFKDPFGNISEIIER